MKTYLRKASERGQFANDWLKSFHSFSFGEYYDSQFMGYRNLRVINHDFIQPSSGFPMHSHRDMEIVTYVLKGTVEHQDSLGNKAQTTSGDIQVMTAGTGIRHSEYNPSRDAELELLQIWLLPSGPGLAPGYRQKNYSRESKLNQLILIASPQGELDSMKIHASVRLYAGIVTKDQTLDFSLPQKQGVWIQVARGQAVINGVKVEVGDGLVVEDSSILKIESSDEAELLVFEDCALS